MHSMILALALGFFLGFSGLASRFSKWVGNTISVGVALLLFLMGAKIGGDAEIMAGLSTLGLEAFLYAAAAVGGSLLAVKVLERTFLPAGGQRGKGGQA